jgi:hypothetical protein
LRQSSEWQYKNLVQRFAETAIKDNAEWFDDYRNISIFEALNKRIERIKRMMDAHGIMCSKKTAEIIVDVNRKAMMAKVNKDMVMGTIAPFV